MKCFNFFTFRPLSLFLILRRRRILRSKNFLPAFFALPAFLPAFFPTFLKNLRNLKSLKNLKNFFPAFFPAFLPAFLPFRLPLLFPAFLPANFLWRLINL